MPELCPGCNAGVMGGRVDRFGCNSTFNPKKGSVIFSKGCLREQIKHLRDSNKRLIEENRSLREG